MAAPGGKFKVAVAIAAEDQATSKSRAIFRQIGSDARAAGGKIRGMFGALSSVKTAFTGLAAGYVGVKGAQALVDWAKEADTTSKYARRLGWATEQLDAWRYAAGRVGVDPAGFDKSIAFLEKARGELAANQGLLKTFLKDAGPDLAKALLAARTSEDATRMGIDALRRLNGHSAKQMALATKLFGRSGAAMIMFAKEEEGELDRLIATRMRHGALSAKAGKDAEAFMDALEDTASAAQGVRNALGGALLPVLTPSINKLSEWIAANRELIGVQAQKWAVQLGDAIKWLVDDGLPKAVRFVSDLGKNWDDIVSAAKLLGALYIGGKVGAGMASLIAQARIYHALMTGSAAASGVAGSAISTGGLIGAVGALTGAIVGLVWWLDNEKANQRDKEVDRKRREGVDALRPGAEQRLSSLPAGDRADVIDRAKRLVNQPVRRDDEGRLRPVPYEELPEYWRTVGDMAANYQRAGRSEGVGGFGPIPTSYAAPVMRGGVLDINIRANGLPLGTQIQTTERKGDVVRNINATLETYGRGAGGDL